MKASKTLLFLLSLGALSPLTQVLGQEDKKNMIEAPSDVAAMPEDAEKTASGLAYKILTKGTGTEHPSAEANVTVHYTGWETDGKMFDSSVTRGEKASFGLNQVIPGWTEGLQLMVVGEKRRFWIPEGLAYGPKQEGSGRPGGLLVFDVELFDFKNPPPPPKAPEGINKIPDDAEKEENGVASKVLKKGTGDSNPKAEDVVEMHFSIYDIEKMSILQDTSGQPTPVKAPLERLLPGWKEGVMKMVTGEKRRIWVPSKVAFGGTPPPGAPAGMIALDVELFSFMTPPPAPAAPADVAAVPEDAKKTESGLAYKVLTKGTGEAHPKATDTVSVHYTGWETDGKMFDSSVVRGEKASFGLNQVIPGWTEGVQLMVVGEKRRFWIPEDLAYGPKQEGSGRPGGLLVFDVELLEIK